MSFGLHSLWSAWATCNPVAEKDELRAEEMVQWARVLAMQTWGS